ncbi:MAG: DUF935 family protein, partial [Bacteroidetes bacterium]
MAQKISIKQQFLNIYQKLRGGDQKILVNHVTVQPPRRKTQDIANWRKAIESAEGYGQFRSELLDLYKDMMLDGYLTNVTCKRIEEVTNREFIFLDADGQEVPEISKLAETSYFETLLTEIVNAKFYGHSLLEILWPAPGSDEEGKTVLIPRKNVKPRWGIVTEHPYDLDGYPYREGQFAQNVIEIGEPEDLGLLLGAAQYVIYKRGNFGDWAEYAQIFGIPFRWATYNNEQSRGILETALAEAGPAGAVVAPEDTNLQFLNGNPSGNGHQVFHTLRQACNEEIAFTIIGNTMTTMEARNSGYAQSKTQGEGEDEKNFSDRRFTLRVLNEQLVPILEQLGYAVKGGSWTIKDEERLSLSERVEIDTKLYDMGLPMSHDYFYDTYRIPKPDPSELAEREADPGTDPDNEPDDDPEPEDDPPSSKKKAESIRLFYQGYCAHSIQLTDAANPKFKRISSKLERIVIENVLQGDYEINTELHRNYYQRLRQYARAGFARSLSVPDDLDDFLLTEGIRRNISEFATFKQHSLIEELKSFTNLPRADYEKTARNIMQRYNRTYLATELLTFEAAAHSAGQWRDFMDRADIYPNLTFSTVGDDRVRPDHNLLDGIVKAVNDPFWDTHTPPLAWRCRCTLLQTDEAERGGVADLGSRP